MSALDLLAMAGIALIPVSIGLGVAWLNARAELRHLRELTTAMARPERGRVVGDTAQQLESSIDAVALEVERIAEGQRFVTRLLQERAATERLLSDRAGSPPPRIVTPH